MPKFAQKYACDHCVCQYLGPHNCLSTLMPTCHDHACAELAFLCRALCLLHRKLHADRLEQYKSCYLAYCLRRLSLQSPSTVGCRRIIMGSRRIIMGSQGIDFPFLCFSCDLLQTPASKPGMLLPWLHHVSAAGQCWCR